MSISLIAALLDDQFAEADHESFEGIEIDRLCGRARLEAP